MKVGVDTLRKATFMVAGLVVATGVPTLVLAFGNGGSAQPATSALSHRHAGGEPATAAGSSDTSSTTSSTTSTTVDAPVVSATTVTTSAAPTTTTAPGPPPCQWSQFTVTVTPQGTSPYSPKSDIPFTVTAENTGPACTDQGQAHCDCWGAYAEDSSGQMVWVWGAPNPPTSSDSVSSPPPVLPVHWTASRSMTWDQSNCTYSSCPSNTYVQPGRTYELVGLWADHVLPKPDASQPVPVSIAAPLLF